MKAEHEAFLRKYNALDQKIQSIVGSEELRSLLNKMRVLQKDDTFKEISEEIDKESPDLELDDACIDVKWTMHEYVRSLIMEDDED